MTIFSNTFGLAMRNFTTWPELPDPQALIDYAVTAEALGFDSVWVWDHIFLGVDPPFPVIDLLTLLSAVAARTSRIKLGTGVLVLPLRNPVVLAKELSSLDLIAGGRLLLGMASGWYKREFDAVGVPFHERGRIMDRNLEILRRLWTEDAGQRRISAACLARLEPVAKAAAPAADADRRLCRSGAETRGAERRLADLFLHARELRANPGPRSAALPRRRARTRRACSTPTNCRSMSARRARRSSRR